MSHITAEPVSSELLLKDLIQRTRNPHALGGITDSNGPTIRTALQDALGSLPDELHATACNDLLTASAVRGLISLTDGFNFDSAIGDVLEQMPGTPMTEHEGMSMLTLFGQAWAPLIDAFDDSLKMPETADGSKSPAQAMRVQAAMTESENVPLDIHNVVCTVMNEMGLNGTAHPFLIHH